MAEQDASDPNLVSQADKIAFYTPENAALAPPVKTIIGPAEGNSCNNVNSGFSSSDLAALKQLKLKAFAMGANGIVGVRYQHSGTSFAKNCWASVTASGTAVLF